LKFAAIAGARRTGRDARDWGLDSRARLRCGASEHGGFDFDETHFVHYFADFENDFVAQRDVAMRLGATEIDVAIAEAGFFGGVDFVFYGERRSFCVVQDVQVGGD